jgi:hypothetical protein
MLNSLMNALDSLKPCIPLTSTPKLGNKTYNTVAGYWIK